jgi:hypothetical protein
VRARGEAPASSAAHAAVGRSLLRQRVHTATPARRSAFSRQVLARFGEKLRGRGAAASGQVAGVAGGSGGAQLHPQLSVEAQVQALIECATSRANLARMYEGWMAWV